MIIFTDGGSRGNPGPSAIGFVLIENDKILHAEGKVIGEATNNVAEYVAVVDALDKALELGATKIWIKCDSALVVNQILGKWSVNGEMVIYTQLIHERLTKFSRWEIQQIPREINQVADFFVNWSLDKTIE